MKLNKEDLVDLLCTATYDCEWLICSSLKSEAHLDECFDDEYLENRCREDKWADRLLAGGTILCVDCEDDGKEYKLTLENFEDGLEKALYDSDIRPCFGRWLSGNYDYYDCNNLLQYIMFGEVVYG